MNGRVLIIGLGLIGGSLALAIKNAYPSVVIIGKDVREEQEKLALSLKVIDERVVSFESEVANADLIILSTPVVQTERLLEKIANMPCKDTVIITDVGSSKERIVEKAQIFKNKGYTFIGGHPMAGSHKSGVTAAKVHLFENAFYILTPTDEKDYARVDELTAWLKGTKARFLTLSPHEHDKIVGVISHFPHIIAASLVQQTKRFHEENEVITRLAAGGFKDITRIASSSPTMWRDILLHNRDALLSLFDNWIDEMKMIQAMIKESESEKIYHYFSTAKQYRDELPVRHKGAIPSFYDLYVDIPDYPGIVSELTGYLASEMISITNIRILETREDVYGVLRISFQSDDDRINAKKCIEKYTNYETFYG